MTVTAEQVARALRSWRGDQWPLAAFSPEELESFTRHVAAVLSSEPVRIEVQQTGASGSLTRIWCDS